MARSPRPRLVAAAAPFVLLACKDRSATPPVAKPPASADAGSASGSPSASAGDASASASASHDAGAEDSIAWKDYFSLDERPDDVLNAYRETYDKLPSAPLASLDDAVVLCRVAVVEPAPRPSSAWDRANGRDLLLETTIDGEVAGRVEGPLGASAFHVRIDDALRRAASGARVSLLVRDRDQERAYPYVKGIEVGSFVVPRDVTVPLHAEPQKLDLECRGGRSADAARALGAEADRALVEAERKLSWGASDPRGISGVRSDLATAADRIRIGEVIARRVGKMEHWAPREEQLRSIVRRYLASARDAYDKLAATPAGVWAAVGPTLSARVGQWVCPAVPKNADPGSLNDEQRVGCGLVLELRSASKLRFDPNAWGPAYACRMTGPIAIASLAGPTNVEGVCALGVRRGTQWLKTSVELAPSEPTVVVLGRANVTGVLRVTVGDAVAILQTPPPPPSPESPREE